MISALRKFCTSENGNIAITFALMLPVIAGMAALVVDVGVARTEKNHLLSIAESSAIAAANAFAEGGAAPAKEAARQYARANSPSDHQVVIDAEVEFGAWADKQFTPSGTINAVRVTATKTRAKGNAVPALLAPLFGLTTWDVASSAIATVGGQKPLCILVLHSSRSEAFDIDRGAQLDAPDCNVHVNSTNKKAIEIGSNTLINVNKISVVGGYEKNSSAAVKPLPTVGAKPVPDPYANLQPPTNTRCGGVSRIKSLSMTLVPTLAFCGGLEIDSATVTFSPGVYVIKGRFELNNGAHIKGRDVLIYLEGSGSDFFFHSRTSFDLRAAETGPYAGVVIWSDRRNTKDHDIYSKFGASSAGTIYAPSSQVEFEDNVAWESPCIRLVVGWLELDNNSKYISRNAKEACRNNLDAKGVVVVR